METAFAVYVYPFSASADLISKAIARMFSSIALIAVIAILRAKSTLSPRDAFLTCAAET